MSAGASGAFQDETLANEERNDEVAGADTFTPHLLRDIGYPSSPLLPDLRADTPEFGGHVDFLGYTPVAKGWLIGGWITHPWPSGKRPEEATAHFEDLSVAPQSLLTFYSREDVWLHGIGFLLFFSAPSPAGGFLKKLEFNFADVTQFVLPTPNVRASKGTTFCARCYRSSS